MGKIRGHQIIAKALKTQGIDNMYGVVGIPVAVIAGSAQREGINYVGMRHEMPATYAAQASSYLNGRISAALVVSGPGALNAVAAFANAWSNRWPMLLLGGAGEQSGVDMGFFQESEQVAAMAPYAKYAKRAEKIERLPIYIAEAVKKAIHGVPGPSYLDLPGDIIAGEVDEEDVQWAPRVPDPKRLLSDPQDVQAAIEALKTAEQPLIIFGKGIAASRAEAEMRRFVEETGIPYLAMPMAKGIIPDDHDQAAAAARSFVLSNADLIFLAGARLNWMLHFGLPPRFRPTSASSSSTSTPRKSASTSPPRSPSSVTPKPPSARCSTSSTRTPGSSPRTPSGSSPSGPRPGRTPKPSKACTRTTPPRCSTTRPSSPSTTPSPATPSSSLKAPPPWTSAAPC